MEFPNHLIEKYGTDEPPLDRILNFPHMGKYFSFIHLLFGTLRSSKMAAGNPVEMGVPKGKSLINTVFSIEVFDYRKVDVYKTMENHL